VSKYVCNSVSCVSAHRVRHIVI